MKITDVSSNSDMTPSTSGSEFPDPVLNRKKDSRKKQSLLQKYNIPLEELDFDFVNRCQDPLRIERILRILKSGEEGTYPDLENCVVARLKELKPSSKLLRVPQPALKSLALDQGFRKEIEEGLESFVVEMKPEVGKIFEEVDTKEPELPVRGSAEAKVEELKRQQFTLKGGKKEKSGTGSGKEPRIKAWEYDKWDKFDVDAELTKLDIREMQREEWERTEKPRLIQEQIKVQELMKTETGAGSSPVDKKSFVEELNDSDDDEAGEEVGTRPAPQAKPKPKPNSTSGSTSGSNKRRGKIIIDDIHLGM